MSSKNLRSLSYKKGIDENLFEKIYDNVNDNKISELPKVAKDFMIGDSVVLGTSTFYDFLKESHLDKEVHVCEGTACMTAGTQEQLIKNLGETLGKDKVGHMACLGHCHSNSAFMYKDKTYTAKTKEEVDEILSKNPPSNNKYHIASKGENILTSNIADVKKFYSLMHSISKNKQKAFDDLKTSNLRGRGGAGFPFSFKLNASAVEKSDQKYVVCNADEGDPGAYSDMYLMEKQPHKVLFGLMASAYLIGADTAVLYIRGEYPDSIRSIQNAIDELQSLGFAGQNAMKIDGFNIKFKIIRGQGAYVCGEETALLNSIEGLRPEVRVRPPYPAQYGLYGKPTLLSNVETFANLHWILEKGGESYANIGTEKSKGTKLVSLDGHFNRPGIYEVEMGTPLSDVFKELGQDFKSEVKAFQIGGPLGGVVPKHKCSDLSIDFESFASSGFLLGHASVVSIPSEFSMIEFMKHLMKFTADESCGKCYPCRIGSHKGYEMIEMAQNGQGKIDKQLFEDLLETLQIGSLCALGGGVPLPVNNILEHFQGEIESYFN
jgi:NADH:ubiquinone oxidoreductase subunit F (NADH-binding)